MRTVVCLWFLVLLEPFLLQSSVFCTAANPPLPVLPIPTAAQLKWHRRELIMFFHFGMNTFTDSEWGTGQVRPTVFNPTAFNASQWIDVAAGNGFSLAILTAKHHDGFCLWPSQYTDYSVKSSTWRGSNGDVVGEFVRAAEAKGIDAGLYLSPWDRHEKSYGKEREYNEYYMGQLEELLGRYGRISEIWFDGAKGKNATNMTYYFEDWFAMTKQLQGSINIFSDAGPDIRWVGDEQAYAGSTCWSPINRTMLRIGDASLEQYLKMGDSKGTDWVPPECDVSIRKGWFWHKSQEPKPLSQLLDLYYQSVGHNCVLLLNVPPNSSGLISAADVHRLGEFRKAVDAIFSTNLAEGSKAKASSQRGGPHGGFAAGNVLDDEEGTYWAPEDGGDKKGYWIELSGLNKNVSFNVVRIQEAIGLGQRVGRHEVFVDGKAVANGTTVGYKRLHRLAITVRGRRVRIRISESRAPPLLSAVGLHFDPFWKGEWGSYETYSHPY